jgi:hypothetical protein
MATARSHGARNALEFLTKPTLRLLTVPTMAFVLPFTHHAEPPAEKRNHSELQRLL